VSGFGWNFYGFFVFAAAWLAGYFAWAAWMARREAGREPRREAGREGGEL